MSAGFTESDADEAALDWLESLGYTIRYGPEIAYNVDGGERTDPGYRDTILPKPGQPQPPVPPLLSHLEGAGTLR